MQREAVAILESDVFKDRGYRPFLKAGLARGMQTIHTPFDLCHDIIAKLAESVDIKEQQIAVLFNLEFVVVLIEDFGVRPSRITFIADDEAEGAAARHWYNIKKVLNVSYDATKKNGERISIMPKPKKQFDVVIMNPPYQSSATGGGQKGTRTHIWDKFVELSFQLSKEGGTVCNVHPSGWRRGSGKFSKVGQLLRSKQIHSLVLGNVDSGVKTFGVSTGFDWYVLKNSPVDQQAEVTDCNGVVTSLDLSKFDALPDSQIERITGLMAKNSEPRVQFIFDRSAYGHDKPWVQKEKTRKFRHPVVYSLPQKGAQIWFSSKGGSGHFGVPKVIWSNGAATQILVDKSGEYGMTEWAYAIADKPSNLPRIKKAMESAEFLELCKGIQFSLDRYDSKFISLFRADFWKEFV